MYRVDPKKFWKEVEELPNHYQKDGLDLISTDTLYLNHILTYARLGTFKGLNNARLRKLGGKIELYEGLPDFFDKIKRFVATNPEYVQHEIQVEHYIVSTGLRQMVLGSKIAPYVDGVWGCEFIEDAPPPGYLNAGKKAVSQDPKIISQIAYALDNTTKTRAVFEINKGSNKIPDIAVNAMIPDEDRRVPFQNMIYIADGPSDIPVFSLINQFGGRTFAVIRNTPRRRCGLKMPLLKSAARSLKTAKERWAIRSANRPHTWSEASNKARRGIWLRISFITQVLHFMVSGVSVQVSAVRGQKSDDRKQKADGNDRGMKHPI
jgi:hypothetical protein